MSITNNPDSNLTRDERDLLIELRTEMRGLRLDFNAITKDTADRLKDLEITKFSSKEFTETWGKQVVDHEARVRVLEVTANKGQGGLYVIQGVFAIVASIIVSLIIKKLGL